MNARLTKVGVGGNTSVRVTTYGRIGVNHPLERPGRGSLCVGLISGTSADGIDAALLRIEGAGGGARVELVEFVSVPYPDEVRAELLALYADDAPRAVARLCSLNVVLGDLFAEAALEVCRRAVISA